MKYLISLDEREAENNLLWRELAGGRIWDQEFMTHPLHSPSMPSLLFHLTLSSSSWAVNASHRAPPITAGTWGTSRQGPLCSQAEMPGNEALFQRPNDQPSTANSPNPCHPPPFPTSLYPSALGDIKQSHNVFLMQSGIFLLWIYRRPVTESQLACLLARKFGPYSKRGRRWFACTRALNCRYEEMSIAEFPPDQKYK